MLTLQNIINVIKNFIFTAAAAFTASVTQLFQISRDIFLKDRYSIYGNYTYYELILNIVLYISLVILILFNTGNYDIYNTPMVVYNFSRLLYDPLIFILFMYLFKLKTFKSYLEYFEISYTDFLKVSLVLFMVSYGFYFIWLLDSQSNESYYHSLLTASHHIGDQQYVLTSNNSLFHLPIGLEFYVDELSMLFMGLSFLLVFLCIVFLWPTLELDVNKTLYIAQLFLLLTQLQATFTAANLLTFFVAFESLLIPMIIMIAIWGSKNNRQANNYLVFYTMFSAIPMLLAILYINNKTGTLNISELHELMLNQIIIWTWEEEMYLWLAFFLGFAVKTPMVPFHIWLPKAHVDAPTVGSVILAGLLLKVGLVGFIRVLLPLFPVATIFFSPYVSAVATVGVIYSSLITLRQIDMKRIIAYSSVAHMNMALVSLCSLNGVGIYSSIYLMLSHGLIASGLFFLVGFLYNRFHVRSLENYSGLGTIMPIMSMFFFIFTLANIAFPLTSGFIGEFLLLLGISLSNFYLGFLNAFSMLLTTVYSMLLFGRVFLGELNPWFQNLVETKYIMEKVTMEVQKNDKQESSQDSTEDFNEFQHEILKSVSFFDLYYYEINILIFLLIGIFSMGIYPHFIFECLVESLYLSYVIDYVFDFVNVSLIMPFFTLPTIWLHNFKKYKLSTFMFMSKNIVIRYSNIFIDHTPPLVIKIYCFLYWFLYYNTRWSVSGVFLVHYYYIVVKKLADGPYKMMVPVALAQAANANVAVDPQPILEAQQQVAPNGLVINGGEAFNLNLDLIQATAMPSGPLNEVPGSNDSDTFSWWSAYSREAAIDYDQRMAEIDRLHAEHMATRWGGTAPDDIFKSQQQARAADRYAEQLVKGCNDLLASLLRSAEPSDVAIRNCEQLLLKCQAFRRFTIRTFNDRVLLAPGEIDYRWAMFHEGPVQERLKGLPNAPQLLDFQVATYQGPYAHLFANCRETILGYKQGFTVELMPLPPQLVNAVGISSSETLSFRSEQIYTIVSGNFQPKSFVEASLGPRKLFRGFYSNNLCGDYDYSALGAHKSLFSNYEQVLKFRKKMHRDFNGRLQFNEQVVTEVTTATIYDDFSTNSDTIYVVAKKLVSGLAAL